MPRIGRGLPEATDWLQRREAPDSYRQRKKQRRKTTKATDSSRQTKKLSTTTTTELVLGGVDVTNQNVCIKLATTITGQRTGIIRNVNGLPATYLVHSLPPFLMPFIDIRTEWLNTHGRIHVEWWKHLRCSRYVAFLSNTSTYN